MRNDKAATEAQASSDAPVGSATARVNDAANGAACIWVTRVAPRLLIINAPTPASAARAAAKLTESERTVVLLALRGLTNDAIGRARACSARTIANQLASAYEKLGIRGRRELRAWMSGGRGLT
jgi:DNA-binding NarL/FixJ family response regulator